MHKQNHVYVFVYVHMNMNSYIRMNLFRHKSVCILTCTCIHT